MAAYLVSSIDTKDFGGETIRIGDLNNDGAPELLLIQSFRPTREISCLTAIDIFGNILWQNGSPSKNNGEIYSDLPVQIYDWDNDDSNEVLWIEQADYLEFEAHSYNSSVTAPIKHDKKEVRYKPEHYVESALSYGKNATMHVLDGKTGKEKYSFPVPAPADDSFLFANLTGQPGKQDIIIKDRYWNIWGIDHYGKTLWHWNGQTGHYPTVGDVDGDGLDEVFVGCALIDHDGTVLWGIPDFTGHQDAVCIASSNGETRFFSLDDKLRCINIKGEELWSRNIGHGQHLLPGQFRFDQGHVQFAVMDEKLQADIEAIYLFDWDGNEIWRRTLKQNSHESHIRQIDWLGNGNPMCMAVFNCYHKNWSSFIFNGHGEVIDELTFQRTDGKESNSIHYVVSADVWGDSREEAILVSKEGINIYTNGKVNMLRKYYNFTYYPGI